MSSTRFDVAVHEGYAVIRVHGDLDLAAAPDLRVLLLRTVGAEQPRFVIVDCADLTFIDSTGIGVLVAAHKRVRALGCELTLINLDRGVGRPVSLTGADAVLAVHWSGQERRTRSSRRITGTPQRQEPGVLVAPVTMAGS